MIWNDTQRLDKSLSLYLALFLSLCLTPCLSVSRSLWRSGYAQIHSVLLRFRVSGATELDRLDFELNGLSLPQTPVRARA